MWKHNDHKIVIVKTLYGIYLENTSVVGFMTPSYTSLRFHLWTFPLETVYDLHTSLYHSVINPSSLPLLPHSESTD